MWYKPTKLYAAALTSTHRRADPLCHIAQSFPFGKPNPSKYYSLLLFTLINHICHSACLKGYHGGSFLWRLDALGAALIMLQQIRVVWEGEKNNILLVVVQGKAET